MDKVLFQIGAFDFLLWHLLVVIGALVIIALIIVIAVLSHKRSHRADAQTAETPAEEVKAVEETSATAEEQPAEEAQAAPAEETAAEEQPAQQPQAQEETPAEETSAEEETPAEETAAEEEETPAEEATEEDEQPAEETPAEKEEVKRPKNYHISLREDGKWQVKLQKGSKPLKLFDTQAQAIAFAKEKAKNQEGTITIHKVNGQIRKQKY